MRKILNNLVIGAHSLFRGMASADSVIMGEAGNDGTSISIEQQKVSQSVFQDLLNENETQQVKELRDKYYRLFREADKFQSIGASTGIARKEDDGEISWSNVNKTGKLKKKSKEDFMKHVPVLNEENLPIRTIQDNYHVMNKFAFTASAEDLLNDSLLDYDTTLTIERDGFSPRIPIEKFVKKIVARHEKDSERGIVDLYLPSESSQFGKIDAILVSNLFELFETKNKRSDLTDFKEIEWYSDKGWNSENGCHFKYDDVKYTGISSYDGNFVLSFDCHIVENGKDLFEKYKTKEVDEKYRTNAVNSGTITLNGALNLFNKEEKSALNENSN